MMKMGLQKAFHATPFHSNLEKIIENGFLVPGDQESSNGKVSQQIEINRAKIELNRAKIEESSNGKVR